MYDLVKRCEASGKRLTNDRVSEPVRLAHEAPKQTETQESLFGAEEMTRSLLPEKAETSEYVRKQLAGEKKLFGAVGTEAAAERLGETGNVIRAGENKRAAEHANQGLALYDKLSATAGPISDALDQAARRLADGEDPNDVKRQTYRSIKQQLVRQVEFLNGKQPALGSPGTEGLGQRRGIA